MQVLESERIQIRKGAKSGGILLLLDTWHGGVRIPTYPLSNDSFPVRGGAVGQPGFLPGSYPPPRFVHMHLVTHIAFRPKKGAASRSFVVMGVCHVSSVLMFRGRDRSYV